MNFRAFWNRLRGPASSHEQDLDEELEFHREASGGRHLGNLTRIREDAREAWTFTWLRDAFRDLRFGLRTLAANPAFTITATLALVLGIGINATVFNFYNTVMLAPFPVRDAGQTVRIHFERGGRWTGSSWVLFDHLRKHTQSLEGMAATTSRRIRVTHRDDTWNANGVLVSANFFDVFGTGFAAGNGGFSDDRAPRAVLSFDTWQTRFAGNPAVAGEWIQVNGRQLQITGVAARGFHGLTTDIPAMWIPIASGSAAMDPGQSEFLTSPDHCCVQVAGRLQPGTSPEQASVELNTRSKQFQQSIRQDPIRVLLTRNAPMANPTNAAKATPVFLAVLTASLLILLLACANVANLQIARAISRSREIATRLSLGAGRFRIVRQLLAESLILGLAAAILSIGVSAWLPGWLIRTVLPTGEPLALRFENDWRVYLFIATLTLAASVAFGLLPAWTSVRAATSSVRATSRSRLRHTLLGVQVALCAILLCGATLLTRALGEVQNIATGFAAQGVAVLNPNLESSGVSEEAAPTVLEPLLTRLSGFPGVVAVAHTTIVPLGNASNSIGIVNPKTRRQIRANVTAVSPDFFSLLAIPITAGGLHNKSSVVVSQSLASLLWPDGENPIGQTFPGRTATVAGIARDAVFRELSTEPEPMLYEFSSGNLSSQILVRYSDPAILAELPKFARSLDRRFLPSLTPLPAFVERARHNAAMSAAVAAGLSALALVLACVGIYGVAAYNVAQRVREIGIRMALGARTGEVLWLVLRQNLRTVLTGAMFGIVGALFAARLLTTFLYGIPPSDPVAMLAASAILLTAAIAAAFAPARRATAIDPAITLRHE